MTVDARRRKNQKKKLRQKEKKAAADKPVTDGLIGEEEELDMAVSQADPLVVDRVAAEEVIPRHAIKDENTGVVSQQNDRSGSPQIVTEPMGQAMEPSPDLEYEEHSPYQRFDDEVSGGQSLKYDDSNGNDENQNEDALEEIGDLPISRTHSQKHHRSASASAAAAGHLSEETSATDVLLEGSIERRVSLQMKRQSLSGIKPDVPTGEPSQQNRNIFNLYGNQQPALRSDHPSKDQSGFPFPSKKFIQEESLSPNQTPQEQKETTGEEQTVTTQSREIQSREIIEADQKKSEDVTGSNDDMLVQKDNSVSQENNERESFSVDNSKTNQSDPQALGADMEEEFTRHTISPKLEQAEQATAIESFNENDATRHSEQPQNPIEQNRKIVHNSGQVDELFAEEDHEPMPWEASNVVKDSSEIDSSLPENQQEQKINSVDYSESSVTDNSTQHKESSRNEKYLSGEHCDVPQSGKDEKVEESSPLEPTRSMSDSGAQTSEPVQSLKPHTQMDGLFVGSDVDQQEESMPWETSQPPKPSLDITKPVNSQDFQSLEKQQSVEAHGPVKKQELDTFSNVPHGDHAGATSENENKDNTGEGKEDNTIVQSVSGNDVQIDELFDGSDDKRERLPWETAESNNQSATIKEKHEEDGEKFNDGKSASQEPSASEAPVDTLFDEFDHEPMPWEVSEGPTRATAISDKSDSTNKNPGSNRDQDIVKPKKFSFLENDDDLLDDDDDDSYLESDEEHEAKSDQIVHTVESELNKNEQNMADQAQSQHGGTTNSSINSSALSHGVASKYKPSNVPQVHPEHLHHYNLQTGAPPHVMGGGARTGIVPPQPQISSGYVAQQRGVMDGQKVAQKINEEKKKSDAFDFPMDLVSKRTERIPAKPVGVPSSRIGSPPPFELGAQAPPRSSRNNSVASLPSNPYAAVAKASKGNIQSPLPPQGVVLPQTALPLGNQFPPSQPLPFPTGRKSSMRSQYTPAVRTRGFSNVSAGGPISAGTTGSHPSNLVISPPQGPVAPANKYAPTSPLKAATYTSTGLAASIGSIPTGPHPVNAETTVRGVPAGGQYAPPNVNKPHPISSNLPNPISNVPPPSNHNKSVPQAQLPIVPNLPVNSYSNNVPVASISATSDAYTPGGTSISTGPPLNGRGKKTASRAYARSNSSVYAPNQNEHTSKYAPTVHPQYQNFSPSNHPVEAANPLSSINAYMAAPQPSENEGPRAFSDSEPVDNDALLKHQFPLFSWSASEKLSYGVPCDNSQNSYLLGLSSSVRDFHLANVDTILASKNFLKSFPGPLVKNKTRKKDLQKWLEDHFDEFVRYDHDLNSTILSVLKLKLIGNIDFQDISRVLYDPEELFLYLSQPVAQSKQMPHASKLDANNQMKISAYLQTGKREEALQLALNMRDFSMALLIGSLMGKEKWSQVVNSYLTNEIEVSSSGSTFLTNLLSLIFQVFVGTSKTAFQEFYINEVKCKWALENWNMVVAAVLNNVNSVGKSSISGGLEVPPVVVEFLVEYGVFLYRKGLQVPACILFMIANLPLSSNPVATDVDVKFEFVGSPYSLEGMIFSEIYEFCVADSKAFAVLLPQKLHHAACLHERGLTTAASKYTDYLSGILRTLPKKEAFSINLTNQLNNLTACIAGTSTGWLGKPKLSSVWGHLDKSFNKFIGGDDDSLMKKSSGKKVFDGFTPVSSRNNSTLDLSQTSFVPFQGHSKKPSLGHSDTGITSQSVGPSPNRHPVSPEELHNGRNYPNSQLRRASHLNGNHQSPPKVSQYAPSRTSSAGAAPINLRKVHSVQPVGGFPSQSLGISSESLINFSTSQQETRPYSEKVQESVNSSNSETEKPLPKKTQHYSSTPNLLRRSSGISETSSVHKGSLDAERKPIDVSLLGNQLEETSEDIGFSPEKMAKNSNFENMGGSHQLIVEKPYLGAPPLLHTQESSPISTVATESATEDDDLNGDAERTVLRGDQSSWVVPPPKVGPSTTSSPLAIAEKGSGETLKKFEVKQLPRVSTEALPAASDSADDKTPVAYTKNEAGLGIRMKLSESNAALNSKTESPIINANPYATNNPVRKASSKKSYLPKSVPENSVSTARISNPLQGDLNGLAMFVEESEVSKQSEEAETMSVFPPSNDDVSLSGSNQENSSNDRINPALNRFDPVKEPEEITSDTFEPIIKKTPEARAFSPMVVQPPENQYDDVVEDESEDEDEEDFKRKKEEERKVKEEEEEEERRKNEKSERARREKESREKSSGGSGWFSWLKKDTNERKPIKAKLGNKKRNFYYDEKLKRWVNNNATEEEKEKFSTPPPPPPVVRRMDNGPKTKPRSGSQTAAPKPAVGAVAPKNPITGETLASPALSATTSQSSSEKLSTAPPPSSNNSGVNLAGKNANGLDDLLNLAGGGGASTRRKKKPGRGYVNVMETK